MFERLLTGRRYWWLIGGLTLLMLALSYYGQLRHHYLVPPGDDIFNHLRAIDQLQATPALWQTGGYPIGFRNLIVWLANAFAGGDTLATLRVVWPLLPVLSSLAILAFASKLFSRRVGLVAFVIYGFLSLQPLQTLYDGGLPNIFAGNILLPISLMLWVRLWQRLELGWQKISWSGLGYLATGAIILYTHHLSAVVWLAVTLLTLPVLAIRHAQKLSGAKRWLFPLAVVGATALVLAVLYQLPAFGTVRDLIATVKNYAEPSLPWEWSRYHTSINGLLFQGSLVGLGLMVWQFYRKKTASPAAIVLVGWFLFYLIGSRLTFVAEPERLARDLAMPGAVLAGLLIIWASGYFQSKGRLFYQLLLAFMAIQFLLGAVVKAERQIEYNPMIRFSASDQQVLAAVRAAPLPSGVQVQSGGWQYLAADLSDNDQVIFLRRYSPVKKRFKQGQCVYLSYYHSQIWPPSFQSRSLLDRVIANSQKLNVKVEYFTEDPLKTWYRACPL